MKPGIVLGRKFCSSCGRWRLLMDFGVSRYHDDGTPRWYSSECRRCATVRLREARGSEPQKFGRMTEQEYQQRKRRNLYTDPERLERYRERHRIYAEGRRRAQGAARRSIESRIGEFVGKGDAVDSGPFLEWLERWQAIQDAERYPVQGGYGADGFDRGVASLTDLANLAGVSVRVFVRARQTGRVSANVVDKVLIAAGADVFLCELYPSLYPDLEEAS